ncbi:MAG: glycogen synthase [Spirochaetales bacterium]|nr:glycogen synthase [Spirochaetales bacterium]
MDKKKILMVTSEAVPYAKTGGLADVVSALALELSRRGHDVRLLLPRYYRIDRSQLNQHPQPLSIWMNGKEEWTGVYETRLEGEGGSCPVYFLDHEIYFGRDGIYGHRPDYGFDDNAARYALLSRGAFQLCRMLHWIPDVFHCHDWAAAPVCYLLQKEEIYREFSRSIGVLTIHNLGYQGKFALEEARYIQPEMDSFHLSTLEFEGDLNYLKAGIMSAHKITTVSPTYAEEIQNHEQGFKLNGLLHYRRGDLKGILNGIDYDVWNPETDAHLGDYHFNAENMRPKGSLKRIVQGALGLPLDSKVPLVGIVTRLVDQKGIQELFSPGEGAMYSICRDMDVQFALLGSGDQWCEEELNTLAEKLPNLGVYIGYNNDLAHKIEGGCDFFLMPSRYEPCGLNQIYSLAYGTLPIVRATGGLADTVENYDQEKGSGTGFVFNDLYPDVLYNVMKWVTETWYERRHHIRKMRKRAMSQRFTWSRAAEQYEKVYQDGAERR